MQEYVDILNDVKSIEAESLSGESLKKIIDEINTQYSDFGIKGEIVDGKISFKHDGKTLDIKGANEIISKLSEVDGSKSVADIKTDVEENLDVFTKSLFGDDGEISEQQSKTILENKVKLEIVGKEMTMDLDLKDPDVQSILNDAKDGKINIKGIDSLCTKLKIDASKLTTLDELKTTIGDKIDELDKIKKDGGAVNESFYEMLKRKFRELTDTDSKAKLEDEMTKEETKLKEEGKWSDRAKYLLVIAIGFLGVGVLIDTAHQLSGCIVTKINKINGSVTKCKMQEFTCMSTDKSDVTIYSPCTCSELIDTTNKDCSDPNYCTKNNCSNESNECSLCTDNPCLIKSNGVSVSYTYSCDQKSIFDAFNYGMKGLADLLVNTTEGGINMLKYLKYAGYIILAFFLICILIYIYRMFENDKHEK